MTIRFHCKACGEEIEYEFRGSHSEHVWPEWRQLAERQARAHHFDTNCVPRRGLYFKALDTPLRIKSR